VLIQDSVIFSQFSFPICYGARERLIFVLHHFISDSSNSDPIVCEDEK